MNASELRIGNWVLTSLPGGYKGMMIPTLETQVQGITFFGEAILCHTPQIEGFNMPAKHLAPIPLTEEWLIKFDYLAEVGTYRFSIAGKFPALFIDTENKKCWLEANTDMILLDYPGTVHRFQNLHHSIYNEELTIKE